MYLFPRAECNSFYLFGFESPELPLYRANIRCDFLFIISKPAVGSLSLLPGSEVSLFVSVFKNLMGLGETLNSVAYSCILRNSLSKTSGCLSPPDPFLWSEVALCPNVLEKGGKKGGKCVA